MQNIAPNELAILHDRRSEAVLRLSAIRLAEHQAFRDLDLIDAALRLFGSGRRPMRYDSRPRQRRGAVTRSILLALKAAEQPLSTCEVANAVLIGRGEAPQASPNMRRRVGTRLSRLKDDGVVRNAGGATGLWELAQ